MKPQVDASTPILPTFFFPLIGESIKINPNLAVDPSMKGNNWKSDRLLPGTLAVEGSLTFLADPAIVGHLLNMTYAKGSTTGDASAGYTHPFTPGEGKSYTIDIVKGINAIRLYGVRADQLKFSFSDAKMQVEAQIKALGAFYSASLAIALTGTGMTQATLSTASGLTPAKGLAVGDVVTIGGVDITLTGVADSVIQFASTNVTASVGDPVLLKAQSVSLGTQLQPFKIGGAVVGLAADSSAADTAAASRATGTIFDGLTITLKNGLISQPGTSSQGAAILLNGVLEATIETSKLFENPVQFQKYREMVKQAITAIITGDYIKSDLSTSEKLTVKAHNVKATSYDDGLQTDNYIMLKQTFECLYDSSDAKSMEITLVNRTAGTDY